MHAVTPYRALLFCATAFTLASWIFLIDNNLFSQREQFHESDYVMTFYVAGRLAALGRADELYPRADALSFVGSPFDQAAHALLPNLPKGSTGAYMYLPLVAGFFVPLSYLDPNTSLLCWQIFSLLALGFSCLLLSRVAKVHSHEVFFLSTFYFPVFLTLWAGQLGLGFGLLPLCLGFVLVLYQRAFLGGLVWSLLLLKPQFLLAAAFIAVIEALARRFRVIAGFAAGLTALVFLTILTFGAAPTLQWLLSHQVSDATYSSGLQGIPSHLITGLPANVMILFPVRLRAAVKFPLYAGAGVFWLLGLWSCRNFVKVQPSPSIALSVSFIIGLWLSSLTLPHLLYYDLCLLLPAGALMLASNGPLSADKAVRLIAIIGWITVSGFFPILIAFAGSKLPPLILELILLTLFVILLRRIHHSRLLWLRHQTLQAS